MQGLRYNSADHTVGLRGLIVMGALLSALRRRPAGFVLALGLLLATGYGAYRLGRYGWVDWHYRAAQKDLRHRNFAAARAHLEVCLKEWPHDTGALVLAARAARRASNLMEAEHFLDAADSLGDAPGDRELERALLGAQHGDLRATEPILLASLHGDDATAILVYEVLAPAYVREYRLYDALDCLDQWQRLEPDLAQIPNLQGDIHERMLERTPARDAYRRAVELSPNLDSARLGLARVELNLRKPAAAWEQLAVLNERAPDQLAVGQLTIHCLRLLNRNAEAQARLDRLLPRYPDDAELIFERGALAMDAGQPREAETWLRRANELHPSEREWLYQLVLCLEQNGKSAEAQAVRARLQQSESDLGRIGEVVRQIANRPHEAALRCEAGTLFIRNGYAEEGRRWLESALAEDPRHAPSHRALAEYFQKRGDTARADYHRRLAERFAPASASTGPP